MALWTDAATKKAAIKALMETEPHLTPRQVAERVGTDKWYVYKVMKMEDMLASPMNRRMARLEEKVKTLEANILKLLRARGLAAHKDDYGL